MRLIASTVLALAASALAPASASNLIANGGFDDDLVGWHHPDPGISVEWVARDELDLEDSGSVRIAGMVPNSASPRVVSDCLSANPGDRLVFGASISGVGGVSGNAWAALRLYSGPNCTGDSEFAHAQLRDFQFPRATWGPTQGTVEVPPLVQSVNLGLWVTTGPTSPSAVFFDNAFLVEEQSCLTTAGTLCLQEARFRVSAEWELADGTRGFAGVVPLTEDSGYLWFFDPANVELVVKVLDACSFVERFWVFAAGLTNVEVKLTVTDTWSDETWVFVQPQGEAFPPVQDTEAFATCKL